MAAGWKLFARALLLWALGLGSVFVIHVDPLHANAERSREFYSDAVGRLQNGDVGAAIVQLLNALQQDPENLDARFLLGQLRLEQGDYAAAEKEMRRVHEERPNEETTQHLAAALLGLQRFEDVLATVGADETGLNDDLRLLRTEALLRLNRHDEAEATLRPLLDRRPFNLQAGLLAASLSMARGDIDDAREKVEIAIDAAPDSARPWMMKTQLALMEGDLNQALSAVERAVELAPGDRTARLMRAEISMRHGDLERAESGVRDVLEEAPDDVAASFLLASIQAARNEFAEADRVLRRIADITREVPQVMFLSGLVKANLGQHAQAESLLARYIAEVPNDRIARRLLASLQIRTGRHMAARRTLEPATDSDSRDVPSLELLSSAQIRAGELEAAAATLERILRFAQGPERQRAQTLLSVIGPRAGGNLPDEARQRAALVLDHLRSGEADAARAEADALTEQFPDSPVALNLLGLILLTNAEDERAREAFGQAVAIDPEFFPAIGNLERMDLRAGRLDALEQRLRERMEAGPAEQEAAIRLAQLLVRRDRRDESLDLLRKQAESFPDSTQIRVALAALARDSGQSDVVLEMAEQLMSLGKAGDPAAYQAAGSIYLAEERLEEAAEAFERWGEVLPDQPQPKVALARTRYLQGKTDEAEALLEELRERFPKSVFVNNSLVDLALERGKIDEALAVVDRLEATAPELAPLLRARVLFRDRRGEEAATVLADAMAKTPSSDLARELFMVRMRLGQAEEAISGLNAWLATHPDDTGNLQLLSGAYIQRGEYLPALAQLERALQLVPNDPVILNNLSWLRYELGRAGAAELARRAHQIAPDAAEISDTLGWILVRDGELEEGLALLREARAELDDNPDVSYHLAYALSEAGEKEAAQEILHDILDEVDPFLEREKAEALLKRLAPS